MLSWLFGDIQENRVHLRDKNKAAGYLEFENARVRWFLSIDENDLPKEIKEKNQRTFRSITIDNQALEFVFQIITYKKL
jgi:UDP-N-acetyl-2-amino-2-deoxyglucuronate dehydrogenase